LKAGLLLLFALSTAFCATVDTVIVADGGPGPYSLGRYFIDTSTISVFISSAPVKDSAGRVRSDSLYVPSYTFVDEANALLFSEPLDKGNRLRVRYATFNYGMPRMYWLFEKRFAGSHDTLVMIRDSLFRIKTNEFAEENVTLSGYKSINVSVGTGGNMNLEQALDVSLSGEVAPHTTLSGHLTDQGTNIEGTRELSDFDRIYVELDNPKYSLVVGDQYAYWPVSGGIFSGDQKKLTGISAEYRGGTPGGEPGLAGLGSSRFSVKGFGAICGGKYTIQTIKGKATLQGPYYLTGEGEQGFIVPIRGSVSITVNGQKRTEGDQADFTVDYEMGNITFTPKTLIQDDDIIRVEYQYRLFDYQRSLVGANVTGSLPDSSVKVDGAVWYEADDKNRPLDNSISSSDIALMAQSGDSPPQHPSGRAILPVEVAQESRLQPLYKLDSLGRYVFTQYNPLTPAQDTGFYAVWFRDVGQGNGAYSVDPDSTGVHPELHAQIYKYVGQGLGSATDSTAVPLPQGVLNGEMRVTVRPHKWVSADIDVAGTDVDKNLASSKDDNDNLGSATNARITLGRRAMDQRSLWLTGSHLYVTPNFTHEVLSTYQGGMVWDDTSGDMLSGTRQAWQSAAGGAILPGTWAEVSYGQLRHDNELHTDRISGDAQATVFKNYSLEYQGSFFRHVLWGENTRRDDLDARFKLFSTDWDVFGRDEWRMFQTSGNRGQAGVGASMTWTPWMLHESVQYQLHRKGDGSELSAQDTGRSITWDQSVSRSITRAWKVEATSHYLDLDIFNLQQTSAVLVTAASDVSLPQTGLTSHQEYRINVEKASSYQTVGVYAGPGRGDAVWSDSLQTYVAKANGDYILQQHEVYDTAGTDRVRKTRILVNWSYAPAKKRGTGILRDLSWYGSLSSEEHLSMARALPVSSWLPGYFSLFSKSGLGDSASLRFADVSYRQNVDWSPDSLKGVHGKLYAEPFAKKLSDYYENGVNWGGAADRTFEPWYLAFEGAMLSAWRHGLLDYNEYALTDRHGQATEKYSIIRPLSLYVKETGGWARQTGISGSEGWYYRVVPGVQWQVFGKGTVEVSYTYSFVGLQNIVDPRIAQGFTSGTTHTIDATGHVDFASHFSLDLSYHGELGRNYYNGTGLHVLSMQVKAYL
jgi:hypothetical protein